MTINSFYCTASSPLNREAPPPASTLSARLAYIYLRQGPGQGRAPNASPARAQRMLPRPTRQPGRLRGSTFCRAVPFLLQLRPHSPLSQHHPYLRPVPESQESPDSTPELRVLICMPLPLPNSPILPFSTKVPPRPGLLAPLPAFPRPLTMMRRGRRRHSTSSPGPPACAEGHGV